MLAIAISIVGVFIFCLLQCSLTNFPTFLHCFDDLLSVLVIEVSSFCIPMCIREDAGAVTDVDVEGAEFGVWYGCVVDRHFCCVKGCDQSGLFLATFLRYCRRFWLVLSACPLACG